MGPEGLSDDCRRMRLRLAEGIAEAVLSRYLESYYSRRYRYEVGAYSYCLLTKTAVYSCMSSCLFFVNKLVLAVARPGGAIRRNPSMVRRMSAAVLLVMAARRSALHCPWGDIR